MVGHPVAYAVLNQVILHIDVAGVNKATQHIARAIQLRCRAQTCLIKKCLLQHTVQFAADAMPESSTQYSI